MKALWFGALLALFAAQSGCGDAKTRLLLTVDIGAYAVPSELDLIRVETADANDATRIIGRNFPVQDAQAEVEIVLILGTRMPRSQVLTVYGYRGNGLVATSEPTPVVFEEGDLLEVRVGL